MQSFVDVNDPDEVRAAGTGIVASALTMRDRVAAIVARIADVEATNPFSDDGLTGPRKADYFAEGPPARALDIEGLADEIVDLGYRAIDAMAEYEAADDDALRSLSGTANA